MSENNESIEALKAEIERLNKLNSAFSETLTFLNKTIKFEKGYADSLRKDAERYRFLRSRDDFEIAMHNGDELDLIIDKEMEKARG